MNSEQNIEETLWNYIDGTTPPGEKTFVEELLKNNQEWKTKYDELLEVHELMLNHLELDEPSLRFTRNVMEDIARLHISPATRTYINKNIIWGIGIFFLTTIAALIIYGFGQINWSDTSSGSRLLYPFQKTDLSKFFNNTYTTIFMMMNVVLGLMLLDMYLTRKKTLRIKH